MSEFKDGMKVWITVRTKVEKRTVKLSEDGTYLALYSPGRRLDCCRTIGHPDIHLTELDAWRRMGVKEDKKFANANKMHAKRVDEIAARIQALVSK